MIKETCDSQKLIEGILSKARESLQVNYYEINRNPHG